MEEDYAMIIGLQNYPGLDDPDNEQPPLQGPEYDAKEFEKWILSPKGGNVPSGNITMTLSSDFPPPFSSLVLTKPTELEIVAAFQKLHTLSDENIENGLGPRVGRRLYIYMSGHGIAPTPFGNKTEKESALLMANVNPKQVAVARYHIPGVYTATWFCENNYFDEVFLFMDCCRDLTIVPFINILFSPKGNADTAKRFYAFATKWSRRAREKEIDGQVQGVFTKTLLLGLYGAAAEPDPANPAEGIITFESLQSYLLHNMKKFIDPPFQDDPKVQEPDINYSPAHKGHIIIKTALQKFPVTIPAPAGASGDVGIYSNTSKSIIKRLQVNDLPTVIDLPREEYALIAIVKGSFQFFPLKVEGI